MSDWEICTSPSFEFSNIATAGSATQNRFVPIPGLTDIVAENTRLRAEVAELKDLIDAQDRMHAIMQESMACMEEGIKTAISEIEGARYADAYSTLSKL